MRAAQLDARIASLKELDEVVRTMRTLAAARLQQARAALPGIRQYADGIDAALAATVSLLPAAPYGSRGPGNARGVVVLFAAEHGFVGAFNERLLEAALPLPEGGSLLVIGSRGAAAAVERGTPPAWTEPMATHVAGLAELARRVADEAERRLVQDGLTRVTLVFAHAEAGAAMQVARRAVLPFDPRPYADGATAAPPLLNLPPERLLPQLVDEFFFAAVVRAATESLAAENAARLLATEAATDNVERKLEELSRLAQRRRQEEITTELLDVVAGAEAMRQETL